MVRTFLSLLDLAFYEFDQRFSTKQLDNRPHSLLGLSGLRSLLYLVRQFGGRGSHCFTAIVAAILGKLPSICACYNILGMLIRLYKVLFSSTASMDIPPTPGRINPAFSGRGSFASISVHVMLE